MTWRDEETHNAMAGALSSLGLDELVLIAHCDVEELTYECREKVFNAKVAHLIRVVRAKLGLPAV